MDYILMLIVLITGLIIGIRQYNKKTEEEKKQLFYGTIEKIRGFVLDLIFEAEKLYQSGTGQFKKAYVINLILNGEFYKGLPELIKKMVTYTVLSDMVDNIVGTVFNTAKQSNKELQNRLSEQEYVWIT